MAVAIRLGELLALPLGETALVAQAVFFVFPNALQLSCDGAEQTQVETARLSKLGGLLALGASLSVVSLGHKVS